MSLFLDVISPGKALMRSGILPVILVVIVVVVVAAILIRRRKK